MTTEKQILANRNNALNSTGPRTVAGMAISSRNAVKHGLLAADVVIPGEDACEFDSLRQDLHNDLSPVGQLELMLADRIIGLLWKLRRSGRMENELFMALMNPDFTEEPVEKEKPGQIRVTYTREDGSTYIGKHYSISKTDGVKNLLKEPKPEEIAPTEPVKTVRSLGTIALQDFTSGNILSRFRRYEGQIERSLFKTLKELHRQQWLRKRNEMIISEEGCQL